MQVEYEIKVSSPDKGKGVFLKQKVKQYDLIWDFNSANINIYNDKGAIDLIDKLLSDNNIDLFKKIINYAYFLKGGLLIDIINDDGRYFNHSNNPNIALGSVLKDKGIDGDFDLNSSYALKDLDIDDELFDDYNTYGIVPEWFYEIYKKIGLNLDYLK